MALSKNCIETLTDLVEIKLSCMDVFDREDARERDLLQRCLVELRAEASGQNGDLVEFPLARRRGRRPRQFTDDQRHVA
ncbi:MAG: hypothetical protein GC191_19515 [Azospirillum sp.]|nr:hypothetical protein [Azospirillum sp.]